jgi:tRNA modification GTPase
MIDDTVVDINRTKLYCSRVVFEHGYDTDDPIVALATPWGTSALALIRATGRGSLERLASLFSSPSKLLGARGGTFVHGVLYDPVSREELDEVIVMVFREPASYTGEDGFDISCHGSLPGIAALLGALRGAGFRDAEPGEFTLRGFLNGKMDLTRAEAVRELVESKSRKAHVLALSRLSGSIEKRIIDLRSRLVETAARIEVALDYPEDEMDEINEIDAAPVEEAMVELEKLLATFRTGKLYQEGVRVAICGRTNAGKSALFNLFLKEDRSIVSEIHGTTRDYIESWISLRGIPVRLFDTAGLREGKDEVEAEGIRRTTEIIDTADLILYLVDSQAGVSEEDLVFLNRDEAKTRCITLWTKIDLTKKEPPPGYIAVSSFSGVGFDRLEEVISGFFIDEMYLGNETMIDSERQKECIDAALENLREVKIGLDTGVSLDAVASDLQGALTAFGELSGEVTAAEVLDLIFSKFCVGK